MWNKILKDYFSFSKKERVAVVLLTCIILVVTVLPLLVPEEEEPIDQVAWQQFRKEIEALKPLRPDSLQSGETRQLFRSREPSGNTTINIAGGGELFYFDPNTLSPEGWKKLGLRDKTIRTIQNFLSKGGKFREEKDIGKIYGLAKPEVERLLPFVRLKQSSLHKEFVKKPGNGTFKPYTRETRSVVFSVEVNTADTAAFIALPGIGSKLASRIVLFREKLGGFYSIDQVAEVYGIPDSTFQRIRSRLVMNSGLPALKMLHINSDDAEKLKQHPYVRWNIANAIVQFRHQHGPFKNVEQLQQVHLVSPEILKKLTPYVSLE
jgi:competence ComEA-like helix-hairpin-helix protein